jgi:hypothetical protein
MGGFGAGLGGTGKSHVQRRLVELFEEAGYYHYDRRGNKVSDVKICAYTHTAVANCISLANHDAKTAMHLLHRYQKQGTHKMAIILDEASMIPLSMWAAFAMLRAMGHIFIIMGDFDGQYLPIQDRHRQDMLHEFDWSDFMHWMVNGLHIELRKYRRGADYDHFKLVASIYPRHKIPLEDALKLVHQKHPAIGDCDGVHLCLSHWVRVKVNRVTNLRLKPEDAIHIKVSEEVRKKTSFLDNKPQDMWVWIGLNVIGCGKRGIVKNGLRYRIVDIKNDKFSINHIDDDDQLVGDNRIEMGADELTLSTRLSHAVTYFSQQARTIKCPLRLMNTDNPNFGIRDLIVGLGRAPEGRLVSVM